MPLPTSDFTPPLDASVPLSEARREPRDHWKMSAYRISDTDSIEDNDRAVTLKPGWGFVEAGWFQLVAACVIVVNTVVFFVEVQHPDSKDQFTLVDNFMLIFYLFELCSRWCAMEAQFLTGPCNTVLWNLLDLVVVVSAVLDQWVLVVLHVGATGPLKGFLKLLRLLRLVRVFKIVRIFLETDLSWTEAPKFQSLMGFVIFLNALIMGCETDLQWGGWFYIEQLLLLVYVFELSVRMKRFGMFFFACKNEDIIWNVLDFAIVVSSAIDTWLLPFIQIIVRLVTSGEAHHSDITAEINLGQFMMLLRMLRLMRILRLVKLVKSVRPLYVMVTGVLAAVQSVVWVLVLTVVVLYAMGIMTTRLIGHRLLFSEGMRAPDDVVALFATVPGSMFTLFRVMSGAQSDDETFALDQLMVDIPSAKLAFVFFTVTSSWTLLSILTAVVSENMISTTGLEEELNSLAFADEHRKGQLDELSELFLPLGKEEDRVREADIEEFLEAKERAIVVARICRVPVRDVIAVLRILAHPDGTVQVNIFLECIVELGRPVSERSMISLNSRLADLEARVKELAQLRMRELPANPQQGVEPKLQIANSADEPLEMAEPPCESGSRSFEIQSIRNSLQALFERVERFQQTQTANFVALERQHTEAFVSFQETVERNSLSIINLQESLLSLRQDLLDYTTLPMAPDIGGVCIPPGQGVPMEDMAGNGPSTSPMLMPSWSMTSLVGPGVNDIGCDPVVNGRERDNCVTRV